MWDATRSYQRIAITDLALEMSIGLNEWERHRKQRIVVNVEMYRHYSASGAVGFDDCVDYDRVYAYLTATWPGRPHTDLIETLLEELVGVCLADPRIEACRVTIGKPEVYDGRATPEVQAYRVRAERPRLRRRGR